MIEVKRAIRLNRGTAQGQMAFWDNTLKKWTYAETSEMFWDDTNKRLGVGTATPEDELHIQSADGTTRIRIDTRNATPNGGMTVYANTTFLGGFLASSTNCDFYSAAGNFGVIQMGSNNNINFARGDTGARIAIFRGDNNTWSFGSGTGTGSRVTIQGAGDTSATSALSVTNLSAGILFFVRNDGNVGIGNNTPTEKLEITGNLFLNTDSNTILLGAGKDMSIYYDGTIGNIKTDLVAASDLHIDCGTDKTIVLDESVWDDIQFATSTGKVPAANYPDWAAFTTNTSEYRFDVDDYIDLEANEMAHWWKQGTTIYPHIHVALNGANSSGSNQYVKFTIYVAYADNTEVWTETTDTVEITIPTGTADLTHLLGAGTGIDLTNNLIGTQVKFRLKRIAATAGTEYPNHIFVTQTGIHAEKDTMGSRTISAK